jgi:flagellar biosynthetic protein FliP
MKAAALAAVMIAGLVGILAMTTSPALAQVPPVDLKIPEGLTSQRILEVAAAVTLLSIAPSLLVMVTCFTRFVIAFSFLRVGLGLPTTPSNLVLISLALFMTFFVMAPTFDEAWTQGIKPKLENQITDEQAFERTSKPIREFMKKHVRERDLQMFRSVAEEQMGSTAQVREDDLRVLIPAFMVSELRRGFEIGFLIALPFLVIDMIVATIVMSMGMMMLSPTAFSMPMKILFFILIDGWGLLVNGLIKSFV